MTHLSNEGGGSVGVVLEGRRKLLGELVVPGKAVDPALDENKMELGILILPVPLKMLANIHSLLDEAVKILGDLRGETLGLEDTDDGVASDNLHAGHGLRVTEKDTNLRGGKSLSGELHDALDDLVGALGNPGVGSPLVGGGCGGDTLTAAVHTTHGEVLCSASVQNKTRETRVGHHGAAQVLFIHSTPSRCSSVLAAEERSRDRG
uniref:Uncharacterized protein n=1 Tax=Palpitomonas bilix TaxID=652834 RepID=A0A7S3LXS3_9EUKA|mmetsp:Transcript_8988/g.24474  ORF Transcript_8988/g.24474 Transcript_8988/m.24474 type:complete len:206 (+) Transcript_8988:83-700(+)